MQSSMMDKVFIWILIVCVGSSIETEDELLMDHSYTAILNPATVPAELQPMEQEQRQQTKQNPHQDQLQNQDRYLNDFGLTRRHSIGDGNCLFRSISVGLVGNEDLYSELRMVAIDYIRNNQQTFANFFHPDNGWQSDTDNDDYMTSELERLSGNGVYAGQECVVALSLALDINILVTYGGSVNDPRVFTMQHFSNSPNALTVHIIFTDIGHYDAAVDPNNNIQSESPGSILNVKPADRSFTWKETPFSKFVKTSVPSPDLTSNTINSNQVNTAATASVTNVKSNLKYSESSVEHICKYCNKKLSCKRSLKRHALKYHPDKSSEVKKRVTYNNCIVPGCLSKFLTVKILLDHLEKCHKVIVKRTNHCFDSMEKFLEWKEQEEIKNNVFFQNRRKNIYKNKFSIQYICNRNGFKQSKNIKVEKAKKKRHINSKGTCKRDTLCPARMYVCVENERVNVEYIYTHSHSTDFDQTKHLPIPKSVKQDISKKLSIGLPVETVIDSIRENVGNIGNRDNDNATIKYFQLINRKNVMEMKRKIVDCKFQKHQDDATSTLLWVKELTSNPENNPVLLYKQQSVLDNSLPLQKDDFLLILMSNEQAEMYKKFGGRVLCIDSTHKTNMYDFKLITLLVVDEYHKGYPVAFCLSNKEDTAVLQLFFGKIKEKCPETEVNILMTDDDSVGINAARAIYGCHVKHYLCIWHIIQAWRRKLQSSVQNKDNKVDIFKRLHVLLNVKTSNEFHSVLNNLLSKYSTSEQSFISYFKDNYLSRVEKWALHQREKDLQTEINTNMFVESFHNKLKTIYFQRKQNKRIDKLLSILLEMEKHYYLNRIKYMSYNNPTDFNSGISNRHSLGISMPDSNVHTVNENFFSIQSSNGSSFYTVHKLASSCDLESCFKKCTNLPCINLCSHMYSCNCPDGNNLCKHVHKVHSLSSMAKINNTEEVFDDSNFKSTRDPESSDICSKKKTNLMNRYRNAVKILNEQMENPNLMQLEKVVLALENLISNNRVDTDIVQGKPLNPKIKVHSNQKFEKQPTFKRTQKQKPKTKKIMKAPSAEQRANILNPNQTSPGNTVHSGPSVGAYPLVPLAVDSNAWPQISQVQQYSFVNDNGSISVPQNYIIPPSMQNKPIIVKLSNGKEMKIIPHNSFEHEEK